VWPTAHAPGSQPSRRHCYRQRLTTTASEKNNNGLLGRPAKNSNKNITTINLALWPQQNNEIYLLTYKTKLKPVKRL